MLKHFAKIYPVLHTQKLSQYVDIIHQIPDYIVFKSNMPANTPGGIRCQRSNFARLQQSDK